VFQRHSGDCPCVEGTVMVFDDVVLVGDGEGRVVG
jgi:hypothetical protein